MAQKTKNGQNFLPQTLIWGDNLTRNFAPTNANLTRSQNELESRSNPLKQRFLTFFYHNTPFGHT